jgi:type IV pilus assembly protein PilE
LSLTTPGDVSAYYTITIEAADATPPTFTVTATPVSGSAQAGDATLTLDNTGAKTPADKW